MAFFKGFPTINWRSWYPGTLVTRRPAAQTEPYKSDVPGFNTRFSLHDLETRDARGAELTRDERQFLDYIRSL